MHSAITTSANILINEADFATKTVVDPLKSLNCPYSEPMKIFSLSATETLSGQTKGTINVATVLWSNPSGQDYEH